MFISVRDLLDADITISESVVQECAVSVVQRLNDLLNWLRDLVFVREFGASFKVCLLITAVCLLVFIALKKVLVQNILSISSILTFSDRLSVSWVSNWNPTLYTMHSEQY